MSKYTIQQVQAWQEHYDPPDPHTLSETSDHFDVPMSSMQHHVDTRSVSEGQRLLNDYAKQAKAARRQRIKRAAHLRFDGEMSRKEVANEMGVSPKTVDSYIRSYRKGRYTVAGADSNPKSNFNHA